MVDREKLEKWFIILISCSTLGCALLRQIPQPVSGEAPQLAFEIQTATPTISTLFDAPTATVDPNATPTLTATPTMSPTATLTPTTIIQPEAAATQPPLLDTPVPAPSPTSAPQVELAEPLRGGEWDFEAGFVDWTNPFGDNCDGSGLAVGWNAFTTRDQYGSSCMNQTTWQTNVYSGENAQEITFAFVGNQAGIFKTVPTTAGHRHKVEAFVKREFSPAALEVQLGIDITGGVNWESDTVQWFPWREELDDQWAKTEETVTAVGDTITVFIKGSHPFPEPGGALRIDNVSVVDEGPE